MLINIIKQFFGINKVRSQLSDATKERRNMIKVRFELIVDFRKVNKIIKELSLAIVKWLLR